MAERLTGLIAAAHTPMHADGSLNLGGVGPLADALAGAGMRGVFVGGTAGEGQALTVEERRRLLEGWVGAAGGRLLVVAHVGSNCLADARALASHAAATGAAAVASMAPSFDTPTRAAELVAFCREIATAAPDRPFYYYHLPGRTGIRVAAAAFLEEALERIPSLGGIKFTDSNLTDFGTCVALCGEGRSALFGRTEFLLAGLAVGAHGSIGGPYNCAAPLFVRLWDAFHGGDLDEARRLQHRAREFGILTKRYGGVAALKAVTCMAGLDVGPVRLPLRDLTDEERGALRGELERGGWFDGDLLAART